MNITLYSIEILNTKNITNNAIILFIFISILQFYLDYEMHNCEDNVGKLTILLHHIFNTYLILGSVLFSNHLFHICVVLISFIVHKIYTKCPITMYSNLLCYNDIHKNVPLITILNHISGLYDYVSVKPFYYLLLCIVILYDVYFINKKFNLFSQKTLKNYL
jgi:hypothetical protein